MSPDARERLDPRLGSEAAAKERDARLGAQIGRAAGTRVIAVRVGDHGARDGLPRIDVEAARRAIESVGGLGEHGHIRVERLGRNSGSRNCQTPNATTPNSQEDRFDGEW